MSNFISSYSSYSRVPHTVGLTYNDVGMAPKYNTITSRMDTNLSTTLHGTTYSFPFVPANMDTVISREMATYLTEAGGMVIYHRFCALDIRKAIIQDFPNSYMSVGVSEAEKEAIHELIKSGGRRFCIDIAHGHSLQVAQIMKLIRDLITTEDGNTDKCSIIAGNVCTSEGYKFLVENGANIVKVGVGGGSACITRMKTGMGVPQFTAVMNCAETKWQLEAEGKPSWLIADGGIVHPKDSCLAIAAGADMVMMGSLFSKAIESAGQKFIKTDGLYIPVNRDDIREYADGTRELYSHYRGQASLNFMQSYYGDSKKRVAEGVDYYTKCQGTTAEIIEEYSGGLRSSMTYAGARNLNEYVQNVEFFLTTPNYMTESNHRSGN